MIALRVWLSRLRGTIAGRRGNARLQSEIDTHLEMLAADQRRRGLTADEAQAAARREFGGITQTREGVRDQARLAFVDGLIQDLRHTIRGLRRTPVFTATAVMSLALGIGANTAIFTLLDALLLRPLPVDHPSDLLVLGTGGDFTYPVFDTIRRESTAFVDVFASAGIRSANVEIAGAPVEHARESLVSGSYFSVLGIPAAAGRLFGPDDDQPGAAAVAVLSDAYWQQRFGRDPLAIGRTVSVSGTPVTIVGVAPRSFRGERIGEAPDFWVPLSTYGAVVPGRNLLQAPTTAWLQIIGRRRPGLDIDRAQAELTVLYRRALSAGFGDSLLDDTRRAIERQTATLAPAGTGVSTLRAPFSRPLQILMAIVGLLLLLACANVVNLLLVRGEHRRRETGLRLALGISRGRLVRQLLTESMILALAGAALGLVAARWTEDVLLRMVSTDGASLPVAVGLDLRVLAFVTIVSAGTALIFGLVPARHALRMDVIDVLRPTPSVDRSGRLPLTSAFVIVQFAISLILLVSAGLFLRTLLNLRRVDVGFAADRLLVVDVDPLAAGYRDERYVALGRRLLDAVRGLPSVQAVTLSENGAFTARDSTTTRMRPPEFVAGRTLPLAATTTGIPRARFDEVGPRYFATTGIELLSGRDIDERDVASAPHVVVISENMARLYFGQANPVGRQMVYGAGPGEQTLDIIGVARSVRQRGVRDDELLRFYLAYFQQPRAELASIRLFVRAAANGEAASSLVRRAIQAEDPRLPIVSMEMASVLADRTLARERMTAALSSAFGALALLLASIGLYGVMAYRVARRTREIGIRLALGAGPRHIWSAVLRQELALVAAGAALGAPFAVAVSRLADALLFGVDRGDPSVLATAMGVMSVTGLVAGVVPMRRAARVDPLISLRHE